MFMTVQQAAEKWDISDRRVRTAMRVRYRVRIVTGKLENSY